MDRVVHRATQGYTEGIRLEDSQRLTDWDFANDIALLGESRVGRATEPHKSRRKKRSRKHAIGLI